MCMYVFTRGLIDTWQFPEHKRTAPCVSGVLEYFPATMIGPSNIVFVRCFRDSHITPHHFCTPQTHLMGSPHSRQVCVRYQRCLRMCRPGKLCTPDPAYCVQSSQLQIRAYVQLRHENKLTRTRAHTHAYTYTHTLAYKCTQFYRGRIAISC